MFKVPQCPFRELLSPTTLDEDCCMSVLRMEIVELPHSPPSLCIRWKKIISTKKLDEPMAIKEKHGIVMEINEGGIYFV